MNDKVSETWAQLETWTANHTPSGTWNLVRVYDRFWLEDSVGVFSLTVTAEGDIKVIMRYVPGGSFAPYDSGKPAGNYAKAASYVCGDMDAFTVLMRCITSRSGWGDATAYPRRDLDAHLDGPEVVWQRRP